MEQHLTMNIAGDTDPVTATAPVRRAVRTGREDGVVAASTARDEVRADLGEVFRRDYRRIVAVAGRVLGSSRDECEDVAQEVFLAFGRSSVPADEASGWLTVAAVHTALRFDHLVVGLRTA